MLCTVGVTVSVLLMALVNSASAADPCAVKGCRIKFVVFSDTPRRFFIQFFSAAWTSSSPLFILNKENAGHYLANAGCNGEWKAHMMNELGEKESEFFFRIEGNAKVNITIKEVESTGKLGPDDIKIDYCEQGAEGAEGTEGVSTVAPTTIKSDSGEMKQPEDMKQEVETKQPIDMKKEGDMEQPVDMKQEVGKMKPAEGERSLPNKLSSSSGFLKADGQEDLPLTADEVSVAPVDSRSRNGSAGHADTDRVRQQHEAIANMCNYVCTRL